MFSCEYCNGNFSNKNSLSTHRSKYHRKPKTDDDKLETEPIELEDKLGSESDGSKTDDEAESHSYKDSIDGDQEVGDSSLTIKDSDNDSRNEDQEVDALGSTIEESDNNSQNDDQDDEDVDSPIRESYSNSETDKRSQSKSTRTMKKRKVADKNLNYPNRTRWARNKKSKDNGDHIQLLASINDKLKRDHENFTLLNAYVLKNEVCSKLVPDCFVNEGHMENVLSNKELWLVKAICKSDLETVRKLMFENYKLLQQILASRMCNFKKPD